MKKLCICLLSLLLYAVPALASFEGAGFNSPEDVVTAYLKAMKACSLEDMCSTFAIETYVDNRNPKKFLESAAWFYPGAISCLQISSDYIRSIAIEMRYAELINELHSQYLYFSWPEKYGQFDHLVQLNPDEVEPFLTQLSICGESLVSGFTEMEILGFIAPAALDANYTSFSSQTLSSLKALYGCDALNEVVAHVRIGNEEYYQFMLCSQYAGKWYNHTMRGYIGAMLGASNVAGGLKPLDVQ